MSAANAVEVIRETERAASLFHHPLRLRLLEHLREPDSASGLARRLGIARQVVNYHLRVLEKAGILAFVDERPKGGMVERRLQASAHSYLISPEALGAVEPDFKRIRDRLSWGYLVAAAARVIRDLGILRQRADGVGKRLATFTLETEVRFSSASDRDAFTQEASAALAALAVKYHNEHAPQGRLFRFVLGAYPAITKTEEEAAKEASQPRKELLP
jgi:DNA-binding transcriptional ArsR family regulator